ncbi:MAG: MFS transporter [Anaerolineae bacterium]|nr:MFS transporter [Anaerolineae bacterium]
MAERQAETQNLRRNFAFGAANHFFVEAAMTLSDPGTVLPLFIKALGGSNFLAGLLPSLRWVGWLAPQFFIAGRLQRLRRMIPATLALESVRFTLYPVIALLTLLWGKENPSLVLGVFFVLFLLTRFAGGGSAVARTELIARIAPPSERAMLISIRRFSGGIAGFMAGLAVRYVLDERVSSFPQNYALLIGTSGVLFGVAALALCFIREPQKDGALPTLSWKEQLRRAPLILKRDRRLVLYILMRAASSGLTVAAPFYILFSTEVLQAPAAMAGIYISTRTFSRILSNMFWGKMCKTKGAPWVLQSAYLLGTLSPLIVLLFSWSKSTIWQGGAPPSALWLFGLVFLAQGLALSAHGIGQLTCLYEIAPEEERPTYYGLANTMLWAIFFLPALGGAIIDRWGFVPIFACTVGLMLLAYFFASKLAKQKKRG